MKILIIGADGQLGTDLCKVIPPKEQIPLTIAALDITNQDQTIKVIKEYAPDVVINTAAYHNVDKCETEPELTFAINSTGAKNVAEACKLVNAGCVYLSTDYVFDGKKTAPYTETDEPNPLSIYGASKWEGERLVVSVSQKHFIIRSTGLYGAAGCRGKGGINFVEGMIKRAQTQPELKVVTDEVLTPTYTLDLAVTINQLVRTNNYGLYHIVNHGQCSWYEFTVEIFKLLEKKIVINKTTTAEFQTKAQRPHYSVLANAQLAKIGLDNLRSWPEALQAYLVEKGYVPRP